MLSGFRSISPIKARVTESASDGKTSLESGSASQTRTTISGADHSRNRRSERDDLGCFRVHVALISGSYSSQVGRVALGHDALCPVGAYLYHVFNHEVRDMNCMRGKNDIIPQPNRTMRRKRIIRCVIKRRVSPLRRNTDTRYVLSRSQIGRAHV